MSRLPLSALYDDNEAEKIFCTDCELENRCAKKGFAKVTKGNRDAFMEYKRIEFYKGAYLPRPLYDILDDRLMIIESEIHIIAEEKRKADAGRNPTI